MKKVLNYMRSIARQQRIKVRMLFITRTITAILPLATPIYLKKIIDLISVQSPSDIVVKQALSFVGIIICFELVNQIARRVFEWYIIHFEMEGMRTIYNDSFYGLHKRSYRFFINSFGGSLVKRITKLVRGFERMTDIIIFALYPLAITLITVFIVLFNHDYRLGSLFMLWIFLFLIVQIPLFKRKYKFELATHVVDSETTGHIADTVTNHNTIAVFGSLSREYETFKKQSMKRKTVTVKNRIMGNYIYAFNGLMVAIFVACSLYISIYLWGQGVIEVGTIVLLLLYLYRIVEKVYDIGNVFKRFSNALGESAEMVEILDGTIEIKDRVGSKELAVTQGVITFDSVNFSYDGNRTIFGGLDLHIKEGEKIALVGQSGAGKSSITKLLLRYFDIQGGSIRIDGVDIRDVTQESLRAELSLVPQEPILFHRTLRENIAYGKPSATEEEIIHAATVARCHDFIEHLDEGYDTLVGEKGVKLSGGERQRIAIARAILEDKKIILLDEATSALDSESEKLIQDAIQSLMKNKTALVIAHRLSTIKEMDRIIVFDKGKIVEQGSHEDLLNISDGIYKKLRTIQAT